MLMASVTEVPALDEHGGFWIESVVPGKTREDGEVYFYHSSTGESTYERPLDVPIIREEDLPEELRPVEATVAADVARTLSESDASESPQAIVIDADNLADWTQVTDDDGDTFFFNTKLNVSIWENPWDLVAKQQGKLPASPTPSSQMVRSLKVVHVSTDCL